jgi:hypothetical protein
VTYLVTFGGDAAAQYHDLPELAQDALLARAVRLAEAPWADAFVLPPGNDPAVREALFGDGHGLLSFYVDDNHEVVRIFNIVWIA